MIVLSPVPLPPWPLPEQICLRECIQRLRRISPRAYCAVNNVIEVFVDVVGIVDGDELLELNACYEVFVVGGHEAIVACLVITSVSAKFLGELQWEREPYELGDFVVSL